MEKKYIKLFFKFKKIRDEEWIESKRKGPTDIGYTFETMLNIKENSLPVPDYYDIEIKTMRVNSKQSIHLFNATPDGDYLYPIERIINKLGYPLKENKDCKILFLNLNCKEYTHIGYYKKAKIVVDRINEKIKVIAEKSDGKSIQVYVSWSFELIKEKLETKIKKLAIVKANSKTVNDKEYFYYRGIDIYEIKSFDKFIEAIEMGIITITFKVGSKISDDKTIKKDNHGTSFSIKYKDINQIYNKVNIFRDQRE